MHTDSMRGQAVAGDQRKLSRSHMLPLQQQQQ